MSPAELTAAVQAIADAPAAGYAQRRRGMPPEVAQRIVAAVVDEAIARARLIVDTWYGGDRVLSAIRSVCQTSKVGSGATNGTNGAPDRP